MLRVALFSRPHAVRLVQRVLHGGLRWTGRAGSGSVERDRVGLPGLLGGRRRGRREWDDGHGGAFNVQGRGADRDQLERRYAGGRESKPRLWHSASEHGPEGSTRHRAFSFSPSNYRS